MDSLDKLIGRYLAGEATDEECNQLQECLAESEENRKLFDQLRTFWGDKDVDIPTRQSRNWEKLEKALGTTRPQSKFDYPVHRPKKSINALLWGIAAAASLLLVAVVLWQVPTTEEQSRSLAKESIIERRIPLGHRASIRLSDGSKVKLNAGSMLSFPEKFLGDKRIVRLQGEAFFEVAEDAARPFIVCTGKVKTTVLGTSFNVKFTDELGEVSVSVLTGKVKVEDLQNNMKIHLKPMEQALLEAENKGLRKKSVDYEKVFGWVDNRLIFKDQSLDHVIYRLERWYGFQFEIDERVNLADPHDYNAVFDNQSLESVLENLCHSYGISYKIDVKHKKVMLMKEQ